MPYYCFTVKDKTLTVDEFFKMGEAPGKIRLVDGREAFRDYCAEHQTHRRSGAGWPFECIASGVAPSQAQELRDFYKKHNEHVTVTSDGNPVYETPRDRRRLLKLRGLHDKSDFN